VEPSATQDDIKTAYRKLANQYHPDKVAHLGTELQQLADQRFKEIQAAYEKLMHE
jgi:DnaJ like chaperone protein